MELADVLLKGISIKPSTNGNECQITLVMVGTPSSDLLRAVGSLVNVAIETPQMGLFDREAGTE